MSDRKTGAVQRITGHGARRPARAWLVLAVAGVIAAPASGAAAPAARAGGPIESTFASPYFTPTLGVESANTTAGAHPDLTIRMRKASPNGCSPEYPWEGGWCQDPNPYIEQDLRDWHMTLPSGLLADTLATAERCDDPQFVPFGVGYSCPLGSKVGDIVGWTGICSPTGGIPLPYGGCVRGYPLTGEVAGELYMGVPQGDEQARLHALVGVRGAAGQLALGIRVDVIVTARQTPAGVEIRAATNGIPDVLCKDNLTGCPPSDDYMGLQLKEMTLTLHGATGAGRGHPLLDNPTSCSARSLSSTFVGYATYAQDDFPGTGTGNTVDASAPFPVTGCNKLDYSPDFAVTLTPNTPGAIPALTTTLSQDEGEQTTREVKVKFPRGLGFNLENKVSPCPQAGFEQDTCPDSARIGSVVARSRFVPEGALSGNVYLGQPGDGSFPLLLSLKGFVDLTLRGKVAVASDGHLEATFSNLPEVPIESFSLSLEGSAEKGMLKVPSSCRHTAVEALFTSHQGKEHVVNAPLDIACSAAALNVDVDPKKTGAHPTVTLQAAASGIRDISFAIPKELKVRKASALNRGTSYGTLTLTGAGANESYPLKPVEGSGSKSASALGLGLAALSGDSAQALATLAPSRVVRSCKTAKKRRARAKKRKKKTKRCARVASGGHAISFTGLPDDVTSVAVELDGKKSDFLATPKRCKGIKSAAKRAHRANLTFSAAVTDVKGTTYHPSQTVTLKCAKPRKSGKRRAKGR